MLKFYEQEFFLISQNKFYPIIGPDCMNLYRVQKERSKKIIYNKRYTITQGSGIALPTNR